jgi:hypothetical protein
MDLDGGNPFLEGVGPEISTFFGPKWHYARSHFRAQKSLDFRAQKVSISGPTTSNAPRYGLLPHPNPYVTPHINNRYINTVVKIQFLPLYGTVHYLLPLV